MLGRVSALVYAEPAARLRMIGVTGTQGKTTTTRLLESGLTGAGVPAAVVGTVGTRILGEDVSSVLTTPEAPDLHRLLRRMVDAGVEACTMEVSSHALVMGRVGGVVYDVGVFLNLGRDHLDFHRDMDDYFEAKALLFTPEHARRGLVTIDDSWGERLVAGASVPVETLSSTGRDADWRAEEIELSATGATFRVRGPGVDVAAGCPIPGGFNVGNTLAAVAAGVTAGYDADELARAIAAGPGVPGRLEAIDEGQDFVVVVDYAHKPDAVAAALSTLRPLTSGRLVVVLGAGGDRDPGKRPEMGRLAAEGADVLVVTDDNPRSEDPEAIRARDPRRDDRWPGRGARDRRPARRHRRGRTSRPSRGRGADRGKGARVRPGGGRRDASVRRPRRGARGAAPVIPLSLAQVARILGGRLADAGDGSVTGDRAAVHRHPAPRAGRTVRGRPRRARRRPRLRLAPPSRRAPWRCSVPVRPGSRPWSWTTRWWPWGDSGGTSLDQLDATVLALTGSQGKTGTKDFLAQLLAAEGATIATVGNRNNEIGVPLTVLRAGPDTRFLAVEMGARGVGHIAELCAVAPPHVAAVLNVGTAHIGEFGSRAAIAQAKGEIIEALPAEGTAVLNADDPLVATMADRTSARVLTFGVTGDVQLARTWSSTTSAARPSSSGTAERGRASGCSRPARTRCPTPRRRPRWPPPPGSGGTSILERLGRARSLSPWRMALHERADGLVVVNDAYNANPASMAAALDALAAIGRRGGRRTVAVLGEMLELGESATEDHVAVGEHAAGLGDRRRGHGRRRGRRDRETARGVRRDGAAPRCPRRAANKRRTGCDTMSSPGTWSW